tara:strand:- start:312 stop:500 length:189 start_codon:yes stop_codon:yes gene_type:complete
MVQAEVIALLNRWTAESDLDNLSIAESAGYAINLWMSGESPEEYDKSMPDEGDNWSNDREVS